MIVKKTIHKLHLFLLLAFFISCQSSKTKPASGIAKPNILVILADDAGYHDFGFQGSTEMKTPNIDKLAENGIIFSDAHVSASVCSPSRAGLMTGRYQQRFGHESNNPPANLGMDTTETTIADVLKKNGYQTAVFGKWHLGTKPRYHPNSRGFDYFYGLLSGSRSYFPKDYGQGNSKTMMVNRKDVPMKKGYVTDAIGDTTVNFIKRSTDKPFFIYLSFTAVHTPMQAKKEDLKKFEGDPRQTLAAMTWAMDRAVGKVVKSLKKKGKLENTLIFFLSDNGGSPHNTSNNEPLKGWKGKQFEGGHRVPFFVYWKNHMQGGQTFDGLSSSMDIFPTAIAAAGIDSTFGKPLVGVNLLPHLTDGKQGDPHEKLYAHRQREGSMRDGKWKLIHLENYGYVMYDLDKNLGETNDLKGMYPSQFKTMKNDLKMWENEMPKPLWLEGKRWVESNWKTHKRLMNNN